MSGSIPQGHRVGVHSGEPIEYLILNGIEEALQAIKISDGYWNDLDNAKIVRRHLNIDYEDESMGNIHVDDFPVVVVNTGTTSYQDMLGFERQGTMRFPIIGHVYDEDNVDRTLMRFSKDIERAIFVERNNGCPFLNEIISAESGKIQLIYLEEVVTDEQFLAPWGQFVQRWVCEFTYSPNLQKV